MWNKLKYTLRTLKRNKLILTVNVVGMTIALSLCLLLFTYINHELSYDKQFKDSERIVRTLTEWTEGDNSEIDPICIRKAHTELPLQVPEIVASTQIYRNWNSQLKAKNNTFQELKMLNVDSTFFQVFNIPFVYGNKHKPFNSVNSVILTESIACKIYGASNPVGEIITIEKESYTISAVTKDLPNNTHFNYQVLMPMQSWIGEMGGLEFFTYYKLIEPYNEQVALKISDVHKDLLESTFAEFNLGFNALVEPLERIHLFTQASFDLSAKGSLSQIGFVAAIGFVVLCIAIFNGVNLFIAFSRNRLVEIGIKKTIGASSKSITKQMLIESFTINSMALLFAFLLAYLLMEPFAKLIHRSLNLSDLFTGFGIGMLVLTIVFSTLASGLYPAFLLVKNSSVSLLRGKSGNSKSQQNLSGALVTFQFAIAVVLLFSLLNINNQVNFLKEKPLGLNPKNVIVFSNFDRGISEHREALQNDLTGIAGVENLCFSAHRMGGGCSGQGVKVWGSDKDMSINSYRIQPGFCTTYELELLWGRFFKDAEFDREDLMVMNKAAADKMGITETGNYWVDYNGTKTKVIGVVSNFSYAGSAEEVQPIMLNCVPVIRNISLKFNGQLTERSRSEITSIIEKYSPDYLAKIDYTTQVFARMYMEEERVAKIVAFGGLIAIFISLMGVFAITIFNLQKRIKELGVRKVLGADLFSLSKLELLKLFKWVMLAIVIALPIGVVVINRWFDKFPFHASWSMVDFLIAAIIPLALTLLVVGWHCLSAARRNPVESLRYE